MSEIRTHNRQKLQTLLRELFQFDAADLDFGIYRILNQKRGDIERFIEQDLLDAVAAGLADYQKRDREELETKLKQLRRDLGPAIDDAGAVKEEFRQMPIALEYMKLWETLQQLELAEETESRIFNDLITFFSRYYDNGDFLSKRRYSSRGPKYIIPYNGEEVLLHWANRDQYYVKTSEYLTDYRFQASDASVWFRLEQASLPQDNVKGDSRYFITRPEEPLKYDPETVTLTIYFEYRPLTEAEESKLLGIYNNAQNKSKQRKTVDSNVLCFALEQVILEELDDPTLKVRLAAVPQDKDHSILGQHLNRYTARNTMDYFIHKDLGGFLRQELDFFLKNEVLSVDDVIGDQSAESLQLTLARMRVVQTIAENIIAFLAQIENFQKRLFEKKKFVVQTDYCLTLDRVPEVLYPEILANQAQLDAWCELYRLEKWPEDLFWRGDIDEAFLQNHPYLMIDTAFFDPDFGARLLAIFDNLDEAIDGLLLHSENFQALNLLQAKFAGQIKCVCIDPPYNTGQDGFPYKDGYQHSSWLSMVNESVSLARRLMSRTAIVSSSIDDNEVYRLDSMFASIFGEKQRVACAPWRSEPSGGKEKTGLRTGHEYLLIYHNGDISEISQEERSTGKLNLRDKWGKYRKGRELRKWGGTSLREDRPNQHYALIAPDGTEVYPIRNDGREGHWRWGIDNPNIKKALVDTDFFHWKKTPFDNGASYKGLSERWTPYEKIREEKKSVGWSTWLDSFGINADATRTLKELFGFKCFETPKPVQLLNWFINLQDDENGIVLDFFAGSGTTAHAVMQLNQEDSGNRNYILVEMGDYFDTVLKPRIQKVAFSDNWKDGVPQDKDGQSHMFKYQRLESYEDALNNIRVRQPKGGQQRLLYDELDDYLLSYMLDFETQESPTLLSQEAFEKPFAYRLLNPARPSDTPIGEGGSDRNLPLPDRPARSPPGASPPPGAPLPR